jgi:hypothetical protein
VRGARHPRIAAKAGLLLVSAAAIALGGCGGSGTPATPAALRLQREDLIASARALAGARASVATAVGAAKLAWPLVANGLPGDIHAVPAAIEKADRTAAAVALPALFEEANAAALTGTGAKLAGLFRTYNGLSSRGWTQIGAAIEQLSHGNPAAARFARGNVALYIESVYDGHFDLAQIGKQLADGYTKLGGPAAFGAALTQSEVDALAAAYSQANDRLHPHVGVRLGT